MKFSLTNFLPSDVSCSFGTNNSIKMTTIQCLMVQFWKIILLSFSSAMLNSASIGGKTLSDSSSKRRGGEQLRGVIVFTILPYMARAAQDLDPHVLPVAIITVVLSVSRYQNLSWAMIHTKSSEYSTKFLTKITLLTPLA